MSTKSDAKINHWAYGCLRELPYPANYIFRAEAWVEIDRTLNVEAVGSGWQGEQWEDLEHGDYINITECADCGGDVAKGPYFGNFPCICS